MGKLKVHELRTKNKGDLAKQLEELKTELAALRVAKVTGGAASKLSKMCAAPPRCAAVAAAAEGPHGPSAEGSHGRSAARAPARPDNRRGRRFSRAPRAPRARSKVVRKSIARVLTVINQTQKQQLRIFYKDKVRDPPRRLAAAGGPGRRPSPGATAVTLSPHPRARPPAPTPPPPAPRRSPPRPPAAPQDHIPLDLRKKQTRAIRHSLTKAEKAMKTQKQAKKLKHFPQRKYAVKA